MLHKELSFFFSFSITANLANLSKLNFDAFLSFSRTFQSLLRMF